MQDLEENSCVSFISRTPGYIRCSDKSLVASFTGVNNSSPCGLLCSSVYYVLLQVWNVVATILHIIGCPVDRISACMTSLKTGIVDFFSSLFSRSSSQPSGQVTPAAVVGTTTGFTLTSVTTSPLVNYPRDRDSRGNYQSVRADEEAVLPRASTPNKLPPAVKGSVTDV